MSLTEHPAWLPPTAFAALGRRPITLTIPASEDADDPVLGSLINEIKQATAQFGGSFARTHTSQSGVAFILDPLADLPAEGFSLSISPDLTSVRAGTPVGLLYGMFEVVRRGEAAFGQLGDSTEVIAPASAIRMLNHWDNIDVHEVMGQVERGYAGGSLWFDQGSLRADLGRVSRYARLLASIGVNRLCINNVNVHHTESTLLTERLDWVVRLAEIFRPWGIRTHLAINFNSPMRLGGLATSDPCDPAVKTWWQQTTSNVYQVIPDFGGYVVKADSEGQPGPFAYGRSHADGANCLAEALAPHGGLVHWRAFVYNHRQDWRDRRTDRARAAYDCFTELDGQFADNVILQVKHGPLDFQVREAISPLLAAMPETRVGLELQVTQEYTGQQRHVYYLPEAWSEILHWRPWGGEDTLAEVVCGRASEPAKSGGDGGIVAVANIGDDQFWTGHPLAQANLYGFGRLAWNPGISSTAVLDEWVSLTFPDAKPQVSQVLYQLMLGSRAVYESYTAPLGVCFMVTPGNHYGPSVDGYEYSPWGTYHFADRDGIGVDRSLATGTGYAGQYHQPWASLYESVETCPDELLLFFHHVAYDHVLHSGKTVIQHIYDTHFEGAAVTETMRTTWSALEGLIEEPVFTRVSQRLDEQVRCAAEWRDQVTTYFWRHSGIPDQAGRPLY